jgi:hemoglobin-like flavoprotein
MQRTLPAHAQAIEASLEIAAEKGGDLTPRVYALLFRRQPQIEAHFWRDRNNSIKGEMLMRVIEAILDFIGERHNADHLIQCEVITHEGYDVPREVFRTFFGLVAEVVRDTCGDDWTEAMESAWRQVLAELDFYVTHPEQVPA